MNYNMIGLPNEEYNRKGKKIKIPDLKQFIELFNQDIISIEKSNLKDSYLIIAVTEKKEENNRHIFKSSNIKYIIFNPQENTDALKNYHRLGLELAMMNKYIPIFNTSGKLLFNENYFNYIRNQMKGLSHYNLQSAYELAPLEELIGTKIEINDKNYDIEKISKDIEKNLSKTEVLRDSLISIIEDKLDLDDVMVETTLQNDLDPKIVELLDIGSTGRGTNIPGEGDFDFIMRIADNNYDGAVQNYSTKILDAFGLKVYDVKQVDGNDLRLKDIYIPGINDKVAIDITFTKKSPKVNYSTEMCIQDKLNTIKEKYPNSYYYVLANIILAKTILKDFKAYKKKNSREDKQGGMGGIGVENWILQNNGSFYRASKSFLEVAQKISASYNMDIDLLVDIVKNNYEKLISNVIKDAHGVEVDENYKLLIDIFKTFQSYYPIYDFGQNHKIAKAKYKRNYPYDNFIYNMNAAGFYKMVDCLLSYTKAMENNYSLSNKTI